VQLTRRGAGYICTRSLETRPRVGSPPYQLLHHGARGGRGAAREAAGPPRSRARRRRRGRPAAGGVAVVVAVRRGRGPRRGGARRRGAAGVVGAGVPPGARAALDGARGARPPRHAHPGLALPPRLRPVRPPRAARRRRVYVSLASCACAHFLRTTDAHAQSSVASALACTWMLDQSTL
jgi:hypothetical protein